MIPGRQKRLGVMRPFVARARRACTGAITPIIRPNQRCARSREAVEHAFDKLKLAHLVDGFRGRVKGDRKAAIDAIMAVAAYAERERDTLVELDVNPVLILEQGAVAVDAMIRKARA